MTTDWPEIQVAIDKHQHELHLSGAETSQRLAKINNQPPEIVYDLKFVNFLDINRTSLMRLGTGIGQMKHLTTLSLFENNLESIPSEIGALEKLKYLDLSKNKITKLPEELGNLSQILTLNLQQNQLTELPDLSMFHNMTVLDASSNCLTSVPSFLNADKCQLMHLHDINLKGNAIAEIPSNLSTSLPVLKLLNLEENKITEVPGELGDNHKLKELLLKGNKLKDRRLLKLVDQHHKSLMEYVRKTCPRGAPKMDNKKTTRKSTTSVGDGDMVENGAPQRAMKENGAIIVLSSGETRQIFALETVTAKIRPFIVCCVVHNVDLQDGRLKKFLALQTRLHADICKKRVAATIATHDLSLVHFPLTYTTGKPCDIMIRPLNRKTDLSGFDYMNQLKQEAEAQRKKEKIQTYSKIHQYLHLVRQWPKYPYLEDNDSTVISLPPLTNSEVTRLSADTEHVLLEVTSSESLAVAKSVMDALLIGMIETDLTRLRPRPKLDSASFPSLPSSAPKPKLYGVLDEADFAARPVLVVEQGRVSDGEGALRVAYPAKHDLETDRVELVWEAFAAGAKA